MDANFQEFSPKIPREMYAALQTEDVQIIGIQASTALETSSLEGTKIQISDQGATISLGDDMVLRRPLKPSSQFLALKPAGPNGEVSKAKVAAVMEMFELDHKSETTALAEDTVKKTLQSLEVLIKSEDVHEAGIKPQLAQKKWEMRKQLGLGGLAGPLASVGWDLGPEMEPILQEDAWAGDGEVPKKKRKSCFSASEQKRQRKAEAERLRNIEGSYTVKVTRLQGKEVLPMVACWSLSHVTQEHFEEVYFDTCMRGNREEGLTFALKGSLESSDSLKLAGIQDQEPVVKLLMGILQPTGTVLIHPSHCFFISVAKSADPLDEAKSYVEQRRAATEGFGTEKRLRITNTMRERMERNCEVADLEKCQGMVQDKVHEQQKAKASNAEKEKKASQGILPPFDPKAETPDLIYKEGLDAIAPDEYWIKDTRLISPSVQKMLRLKNPEIDKLSDRKENDVEACGSYLALQVLKARAAQGMPPPSDTATLNVLSRKFGVLKCLLIILQDQKKKDSDKQRGGKGISRRTLCYAIGLPQNHPLVWQLYQYCYDAMVGNVSNRALNKRKTLCALIVWALSMTEALYIDVTRKVQEELRLDTSTLKTAFKCIGCSVETSKGDIIRIQLVQAPPSGETSAQKPPKPPDRTR